MPLPRLRKSTLTPQAVPIYQHWDSPWWSHTCLLTFQKKALSLPVSIITVPFYAHTILSAKTTFGPNLYLLKSSSHHPSKFDSGAPLLKKGFKRVHPIYNWEVPFQASLQKEEEVSTTAITLSTQGCFLHSELFNLGPTDALASFWTPILCAKICLHTGNFFWELCLQETLSYSLVSIHLRTKPIREGQPTWRTRKTQSQSLNQIVLGVFPASGHFLFWVNTWLKRKEGDRREGKGKEVEKSYLFMEFFLKSHFLFHDFSSYATWNQFLPPPGSTRQLTAPLVEQWLHFYFVLWSSISRAGSRWYLCFYFQQHLAQTLAKKGEKR